MLCARMTWHDLRDKRSLCSCPTPDLANSNSHSHSRSLSDSNLSYHASMSFFYGVRLFHILEWRLGNLKKKDWNVTSMVWLQLLYWEQYWSWSKNRDNGKCVYDDTWNILLWKIALGSHRFPQVINNQLNVWSAPYTTYATVCVD